MSESKVVQALERFKNDYCWDKSLVADAASPIAPALDRAEHSNTALADFMAGVRS
jgi:hypothetical protein